jgi:hypothetical protein
MYDVEERKERVAILFGRKWSRQQLNIHRQRLLLIIDHLHEEFPSPYPWTLSQTKNLHHKDPRGESWPLFGCCTHYAGRFTLQINATLPLFSKVETLLHEWAHAHTWRQPPVEAARADPHDDEFYLVLGRIERWWAE